MSDAALGALFAIFIWWFSTGLVLLLDRLPDGALRWGHWLSTALALAAFVALAKTAGTLSVAHAYCAFTSALLLWGWHELSFLSGWVTGPRKTALRAGTGGWPRFTQAVGAILWHELAIAAVGIALIAATWGEPNQTGTLTFVVLWVMRTSAKLNLFLGVRNWSEEFLPPQLAYLRSFFRRRAMNPLLPLSVLLAGAVLWRWLLQAADPATGAAEGVGTMLVATMLALAIVEHLMLVMPFDATALWRWALRRSGGEPASGPRTEHPVEKHDDLLRAR
jgi:putative photosynthetic complex assembly protein 2